MKNLINLIKFQYYSLISLKKYFLIIFILGTVMIFNEPSFFIFAIAMMLMGLTYSSATYEEKSKINYLVYSLPVKAKDYILSKFIFCLLNTSFAAIFCTLIYIICSKFNIIDFSDMPLYAILLTILCIGTFLTAIVVPLGLIIGFEKSRLLMIFLVVFPVCFSTELVNFLPKFDIVLTATSTTIIILLIIITIILASYFITSNIYAKRDVN